MVVVTWPRRSEARSLSFGGGDCFGPDSWDRSESLGNPPEPRRSSVARRQSGCRQDPPRRSWSGLGRPLHALGGAPNRPSQPRSKTLGRLRSSSKIRPKGCRSRRAQRPDTSLAILLREQKTPIRPTPSSVMPLIASTVPEPWPRLPHFAGPGCHRAAPWGHSYSVRGNIHSLSPGQCTGSEGSGVQGRGRDATGGSR